MEEGKTTLELILAVIQILILRVKRERVTERDTETEREEERKDKERGERQIERAKGPLFAFNSQEEAILVNIE